MEPEPDNPPQSSSAAPIGLGFPPRGMEAAERLYTLVTSAGDIRFDKAAASSALEPALVTAGWQILVDSGLVRPTEGGGFEAVHPDAALASTLAKQQQLAAELGRQVSTLNATGQVIVRRFGPLAKRLRDDSVVERYVHRDQRDGALRDMSATAQASTDSIHPGPMPADITILERSLELDATMLARGIRSRVIYPRYLLQTPKYKRYLHDLSDLGVMVRLIDHAPHDLLIFDGHTVFLTDDPDDPSKALILVRGYLVKTYVAAFEDYWWRSKPLGEMGTDDDRDQLDDQECAIINLLNLGSSDDLIAKRLGVTRRTVQRRITGLMKRTNTTTRFELGVRMAKEVDTAHL